MKEKQEKIISSSIKLFNENGFGATSTASIANDAGIGTGTLFNYYSTKNNLINELILYVCHDYISKTSNIKEKKDFKRGMIELWNNCIDYALEYPEKFNFYIKFRDSPYITEDTKEKLIDEGMFFVNVYRKFYKKGEVKEPYELFCLIMNADLIATLEYIKSNPDNDLDKIRDISFDFLWNGVKK
jgi:AcrR family transcriptional regulator